MKPKEFVDGIVGEEYFVYEDKPRRFVLGTDGKFREVKPIGKPIKPNKINPNYK